MGINILLLLAGDLSFWVCCWKNAAGLGWAPRRCMIMIKRLESKKYRKKKKMFVCVQVPKGRLRLLCSQVTLRIWGPEISWGTKRVPQG